MAEKIDKAAFTRADLVEIVGAQLPIDTERSPREVVEAAVDEIGMRLTGPRAAHQREGHERFTLDRILAEEAVLPPRTRQLAWASSQAWREDTRGLRLHREALSGSPGRRGARASRAPFDRRRLATMAEKIDKAAFTRADLVEIVGAQLPDRHRTLPARGGRGRRRRDRHAAHRAAGGASA